MTAATLSLAIAVIDLGCWAVCFGWMYQISRRQNAVLAELREQGNQIEKVSVEEHRLVKELHPTVDSIRNQVGEVARVVKD